MATTTRTSVTAKSDLTLLNELCTKKGVTPDFGKPQLVPIPDSIQPRFRIYCTVVFDNKTFEATGEGNKIKIAKQMAAHNMMLEINGKDHQSLENATDDIDPTMAMELKDGATAQAVMLGNPISDLQEHCAKHQLPLPVYNILKSSGPSHRPTITMECAVGSLKFEGVGNNKQASKRFAAYKMYSAIKRSKESGPKDKEQDAIAVEEIVACPASKNSQELNNEMDEKQESKRLLDIAINDPNALAYARHNANIANNKSTNNRIKLNMAEIEKEDAEFNDFCLQFPKMFHGPRYQELLTKFREIRSKHPLVGNIKPTTEIQKWLEQKSGGIVTFFKELSEEFRMNPKWYFDGKEEEVSNPTTFNTNSRTMMVALTAKIPCFPKEKYPSAINLDNGKNNAVDMCMVDIICNLGRIGTGDKNDWTPIGRETVNVDSMKADKHDHEIESYKNEIESLKDDDKIESFNDAYELECDKVYDEEDDIEFRWEDEDSEDDE